MLTYKWLLITSSNTTTINMHYVYHEYYILFYFLKILFVLEKGRDGEREEEKHLCVDASHPPPTGDLARNPGMCSGWESNWRPFGLQAGTRSIEPHQPGHIMSAIF